MPAARKKKNQGNNAASKTDQRVPTAAYRGERGSQSIRSPSRDHGAASETPFPSPPAPRDRLSTTHRDKRVWSKNHQLNERLHRHRGSNESMDTNKNARNERFKKQKYNHQKGKDQQRKKFKNPLCRWENKNAEENNSMADHQKAPES